jgi:hypothetical protein
MKDSVSDDGVSTISLPAARVAIGAAFAALLLLASLHVLSPEFDPTWRMVSEYANGQYGWVLSLMFACWGLSSCALAYVIRSQVRSIPAKVGLALLALAGIGEAMAAVFDLNHVVLHNVAGVLGIGGLPIAAMLISIRLGRTTHWSPSRRALLLTANLTWLSLVLLAASFVVLVGTFMASGVATPAQPPKVLPQGVIGIVGWANRLLVLCYCIWAVTVAWEGIKLGGQSAGGRQVEPLAAPG